MAARRLSAALGGGPCLLSSVGDCNISLVRWPVSLQSTLISQSTGTALCSQLTRTPEIGTILKFLASVKTLYDPSRKHPGIERQLRKIKHKPGELPRDYLVRCQKKLIELEDAAVIS